MKTLLLAALAMATTYAVDVHDVILDEWRFFKTNTRRHFRSSDEEYGNLQVFLQTKVLVAQHNERYIKGLEDYQISINHFADWLPYDNVDPQDASSRFMDEISQLRRGSSGEKFPYLPNVLLPENVNWDEKGAVNKPVDQKTCGSCYAFASVGAVEAQTFLKYGTLPQLSEQQIVDCSGSFGNDGCSGGTFANTFRYLMTTGLANESDYPYVDRINSECRTSDWRLSDKVKGYYYMYDGDEEKLKYALATFGPVAVGVNASPRTFQLYAGGVYTDSTCGPMLVHAVLLTGYGRDPGTEKDYWIIKNSWGPNWGESGFMRLGRNMSNLCGIGLLAYVPKFD